MESREEHQDNGRTYESPSPPELQPHHPGARRRALLAVAVAAVLGGAAILALEPYLERVTHLADKDPRSALRQLTVLIKLVTVGIIVPMFAFVAWMLVLARRVYRAQRFPPPGMVVARDTRILRGRQARVRAHIIVALALALSATSLLLPALLWDTLHLVEEGMRHLQPPAEVPPSATGTTCGRTDDRRHLPHGSFRTPFRMETSSASADHERRFPARRPAG
jgi:hypothetical protein